MTNKNIKNNNKSNNTTFQSLDPKVEDFFLYGKHICEKLEELHTFNLKDPYFNGQAEAACKDFFLNNLFLFNQCSYMPDEYISQKHKQMIESLYNKITLYHYTTYETMEKIITGKSIKLSHITGMNDSDEGTALFKYAMSLLEKTKKGTKILENDGKKILEKNFIDFSSKIFSFSFSALEDDAAQWERYGIKKGINDTNEHCGVRIGIPMLKLMKLIKKIEEEFDLIVIAPILYVPNYEITNSMLDILSRFAMYRAKINRDCNITKYISQYSAEVKHTSFKTEYEIRLLIASSSPNFIKINGSILLELEEFDFNNLFSSIMYGPEFAPELKFKMRQLLLKNKIKIKPEDSKCSLRSVY